VYSKSGTNPDYPPLAAAFGKIDPAGPDDLTNTYLNIHPNCLHSLMKYTTIGKTDEQIQKDKDFSSFEKNPITHDPRTKKQIEAYRKKETNRRKYIDDYKQWKKYKAAFGKKIPDFETFRAHKLKDDDKYKEWTLPALSLQPLIGNAVKHNSITTKNPLHVAIRVVDGVLEIENAKHPKLDVEPSTGIGLENLRSRWQIITGKDIEIIDEAERFMVRLPLENPEKR
jgi:hypothetical protein